MNRANTFLCVCLFVRVVPAAVISVSPAAQSVPAGSVVSVNLVIGGLGAGTASSLGGFDYDITYDAASLAPLSPSFGTSLGDPSMLQALTVFDPTVPGTIHLSETSLLDSATLDSTEPRSFTMVTLNFDAIGPGVSPLDWSSVTLVDSLGAPLPASSLNGNVQVTGTIPEPSTLFLVAGVLLLALIWHRRILLMVWLAAGVSFAQMDFATFPNTTIDYKLKTEIDTRGGPNAYLKVIVTLKNTAAQDQKVMLCLYGKSIPQNKGQSSPLLGVSLVYNATTRQFTCSPAAETTTKGSRYGNMGCQLLTVPAGNQKDVTFVSGSSPATMANLATQITGGAVVQDGIIRDLNGAGFVPGHRMQTRNGTFGPSMPLYNVLDKWFLQLLVLNNLDDMGCMKKADVQLTQAEMNDPSKAYTPSCATPVSIADACNKCFGMNTYVRRVTPPNGVTRSFVAVDVSDTVPKKQAAVPLSTDTGLASAAHQSRQVSLSLIFIPGQGSSGLLSECNPTTPGCFETAPLPNTTFTIPEGSSDFGTLNINFPASVSPGFSADFLVNLSDKNTGELISQDWVRVRPQLPCDVNQDGQVDLVDIALITDSIGTSVPSGSPFDFDGDGQVTVADARACAARCTNPQCAQ